MPSEPGSSDLLPTGWRACLGLEPGGNAAINVLRLDLAPDGAAVTRALDLRERLRPA